MRGRPLHPPPTGGRSPTGRPPLRTNSTLIAAEGCPQGQLSQRPAPQRPAPCGSLGGIAIRMTYADRASPLPTSLGAEASHAASRPLHPELPPTAALLGGGARRETSSPAPSACRAEHDVAPRRAAQFDAEHERVSPPAALHALLSCGARWAGTVIMRPPRPHSAFSPTDGIESLARRAHRW
jgi:hypothetical protein